MRTRYTHTTGEGKSGKLPNPTPRFPRILGMGVAGAGLSLLLAGTAFAATTTSSTATTTSSSTATTRAVSSALPGRPMRGPKGGPAGGLTVTAVSGSTITAARPDGTTLTIAVTSNTGYVLAGRPGQQPTSGSLANVAVGDHLGVTGTLNSTGTVTAKALTVSLPHLDGQISGISGNTISVAGPSGTSAKINVGSSTAYLEVGKTTSLGNLQTGQRISAVGTLNSDGSLNAQTVTVMLPSEDGFVTAVNGSTLTVIGRGPVANTGTVAVNGNTSYTLGGPGSTTQGSLSDVKVGSHIHVTGTLSSTGVLQPLAVTIDLPAVDGIVTAKSGSTFTVAAGGPNGGTRTVTVNGNTAYTVGSGPGTIPSQGSLSNVQVGDHIHAAGTLQSSGNVLALNVNVAPPAVDGIVTSVSGSTITVQAGPGRGPAAQTTSTLKRTITVNGSTSYLVGTADGPGITTTGSLSNVTSGEHIHASGTLGANGDLSATTVNVSQAPTAPAR